MFLKGENTVNFHNFFLGHWKIDIKAVVFAVIKPMKVMILVEMLNLSSVSTLKLERGETGGDNTVE